MTKEVKVSHIFVKKYSEAEQILDKLKHGEKFDSLAKTHSLCSSKKDGGKLPPFSKGRMVKEFEEVAFKLNKGEISGVVKTKAGYHIIKREE